MLRQQKATSFTVGLGPSHATRACERVSRAMQRSRGTGPRATVSESHPLHRRARACPSSCVWRTDRLTLVGQDRLKLWHLPSDLDPFVIRRSQTTERGERKKSVSCSLQVRRTLMSIEDATRRTLRSFRSLIVFVAPRGFLLRS